MKGLVKKIEVGGIEITARELLVSEVRQWLLDLQSPSEIGMVDAMLFEEASLQDITRMSGLTLEQIDTLAPSQLRQVIEACKEVNPDFFGLRARMLSTWKRVSAS